VAFAFRQTFLAPQEAAFAFSLFSLPRFFGGIASRSGAVFALVFWLLKARQPRFFARVFARAARARCF